MDVKVFPTHLGGTVPVPPSKSDFQRACAAALLHNGKTTISNPGNSADDCAALSIAVDLGLRIVTEEKAFLIVESTGKIIPKNQTVFCGESGLAARLFIPIAALSKEEITFTGSGSLLSRPMDFYYRVLPKLGVTVGGNGTTLPITVKGPLQPRSVLVDGSVSSQFLSGLLFAFAGAVGMPVVLEVKNVVSQPYLAMSVATLQAFGKAIWPVAEGYQIAPQNVFPEEIHYTVAGDWSSAAAWLVAAALGAGISISGITPKSLQADEALTEILQQTGVNVLWEEENLVVEEPPQRGLSADLTHMPDLFPVLSVLAFSAPGESRITGLHRLRHKESDRLQSITEMLEKGGISFKISEDEIHIPGGQQFQSCTVSSFNDHRVVMAAVLAALRADGPVVISGAEAVKKSYPGFWEDLKSLGGNFDLGVV